MQIRRRVLMAGTTFFLAAATGHVMQRGDVISAKLRGATDEAPEKTVLAKAEMGVPTVKPMIKAITDAASAKPAAGLPDLPKSDPIPLRSGRLLATRMHKLEDGYRREVSDADESYSVFGIACSDSKLTLEPSARAMLSLKLSAPCHPNEKVTITHAGLIFAATTDKVGEYAVMLPAMMSDARVAAQFAAGDTLEARRDVVGLENMVRTAVIWQDNADALHLHAFEGGADYDSAGHVSVGQPRDRTTDAGGFLTALGDPAVDHPMFAEVYTAPEGTKPADITIEATITDANCARPLNAEMLRTDPNRQPASEALSFAMPGCDAVGDQLVMDVSAVFEPLALAGR